MPGKLKVRVVAGRGLPVMDRSTDLTDAFVEVRFGTETFKTDVCKKSLNPQWNSEWFLFEVEDEALQDEPLELRVLDYDTYSAHDAIGKVYVDLNPLLTKDIPNVISGWFPIYDTMHGIRGEVNIVVKVDLFSDLNKFRQSSCGIQFFSTAEVPCGYKLQVVNGFVEELVVNDDPEYQWIDKIRTPRASNEARQRLFSKLSGELQRKIGLKVIEMGGNSVIGYCQCFDLEGESGIVVRGIGTGVTLSKPSALMPPSPLGISPQLKDSPVPEDSAAPSSPPAQIVRCSTSPVKVSLPSNIHRRSSDSDISSTTPPKGSSLTGSSGSGSGAGSGGKFIAKLSAQQPSIELMEYPFFTMTSFPVGFIVHLGGVVSAKSVKLLDRIHNPEEPETRDVWWTEIRTEIRSHMRAMGCHAVLGYTEQTSICDEIIILSASGTAARVSFSNEPNPLIRPNIQPLTVPIDRTEKDRDKKLYVDVNLANSAAQSRIHCGYDGLLVDDGSPQYRCSLCHVPYKPSTLPFPVNLSVCTICRKRKVPDVIFTTIDPPAEIQTFGKGSLIQARVCRSKAKGKGEPNAKEISDGLPFLEYELHNQLMTKLKLRGMNGLFGLRVQITVGDTLIVGLATATAAFIAALPLPTIPRVSGQAATEKESYNLQELQKKISETVQRNREKHDLLHIDTGQISPHSVPTDDSDEDDISDLDLSAGNKDAFVLEVDDTNDQNIASLLKDSQPLEGFTMFNTQKMPGHSAFSLSCNLQMFTQIWRREFIPSTAKKQNFSDLFECLVQKICYKLRRMTPCCLCNISFCVDLPDEDEIQISVTGVCCGQEQKSDSMFDLNSSSKNHLLKTAPSNTSGTSEAEDMMFQMEEVSADSSTSSSQSHVRVRTQREQPVHKPVYQFPSKQRGWVELTPLSYVPGARIERYLGNYNFFFIRETTSLREGGGLGGFMQSFVAEVMANVRASVASLGGNGLVAYRMSHCVLLSNPHKNQSQCLINVSGDAVILNYEGDSGPIIVETVRKNSDSPIITS